MQICEKVYKNVYENGLIVKLQIKINSIKMQNKQKRRMKNARF